MDFSARFTIEGDAELQLTSDQVSAILVERAAKLAAGYTQVIADSGESLRLIAFSRGAHVYGIDLASLTEIRPLASWTPVPGVPDYFLGVIQLRGEIIAVLDIAKLFGGADAPGDGDRFAVVVTAAGVAAAFLADTVEDVHDLPPDQIHPPLPTFSHSRELYIRGLTENGLAILDAEKLLGDERLWVTHEALEERR
ncbi:MAG TPA: chemotaxis protein CheW [Blastocatellia bacterium]|nr:chemotaxis protein CheW [Blastocatellia bacterium]